MGKQKRCLLKISKRKRRNRLRKHPLDTYLAEVLGIDTLMVFHFNFSFNLVSGDDEDFESCNDQEKDNQKEGGQDVD